MLAGKNVVYVPSYAKIWAALPYRPNQDYAQTAPKTCKAFRKNKKLLVFLWQWGYYSGMELLDLLETRIVDLIHELQAVRKENELLRAASGSIEALQEENTRLQDAVQAERQVKAEIDNRIDVLLAHVREHLSST